MTSDRRCGGHLGEPGDERGRGRVPRAGAVRQHPGLPGLEQHRGHRHRRDARPDGRARRRHRHRLRRDGPHRRARARGGRRAPGPVPRGARSRRVGPADPQRAAHPQARRAPGDLDGAGHAAQQPGRDRRRAPLPRVLGLRGARDPGGDQRRHPGAAGALTRAAPGAARGRDDRLPRPRRHRRAHGPSLRGAAHELHAQVAEPVPVVHGVRAAVPRSRARAVHELEDLPWSRALGQRRAVVPDATLAHRGAGAPARRRRDGALPRRHRPPPPRPDAR